MNQAKRDQNYVPTILGVSNADETTPVVLWADPTTHRLLVDANVSLTLNAEYAEDSAHTTGATGLFVLGVRRDADTSPVSTDGDYHSMIFDENGYLKVNIKAGATAGVQYNEDTAHSTGATGTLALVVRQDTPGNLSGTDGDYEALQVSGGRVWASAIITGDALTALQLIDDVIFADDAAFTPGTSKVAMVGAMFDDVTPDSVNEGDAGAIRMSARRELYVQLRDAAGNERGLNIDANGAIAITNTTLTGAIKAEDSGHTTGDTGIMALAVRNDTLGALATTDKDYTPLQVNASGALYVVQSANVTVVGAAADDAAVSGNPLLIAGNAVETDGTDPTSVSAEGDTATVRTDRNRRLLVNDSHPNLWSVTENHASAQTNNELKAAPGAGLSLYITDIMVSNGATAGSLRFVEDTAGTPVIKVNEIYMAINGGAVINFKTPIRITANKNFGFTSTTVTTHTILVNGYIAP